MCPKNGHLTGAATWFAENEGDAAGSRFRSSQLTRTPEQMRAAAWGESLQDGELLPRTILGQPMVLYRTANGGVAALHDACPHRFAPLHVGKLLP